MAAIRSQANFGLTGDLTNASLAFDFSGRTFLVFGAAGGNGRASANLLGSLHARLVLADLNRPAEPASQLSGEGVDVRAAARDARSRQAVESSVAEARRIDALVYLSAVCPWNGWRDPDWNSVFDEIIAVILRGAIDAARAVTPGMAVRRWGQDRPRRLARRQDGRVS